MPSTKLVATLALVAVLGGCSRYPTLVGEPVALSAPGSAPARVQSWITAGDLQLPAADSKALNATLTLTLNAGLTGPCSTQPIAIDPGQRALFDHIAALLQQRPQRDLGPFALGRISQAPADCRQLLLLTGRFGGGQEGWLGAGVVTLPDGNLSQMAFRRWPGQPRVPTDQITARATELINHLTDRRQ